MINRFSIASFSILTLACLSANAANDAQEATAETSPGWTEAPAEEAAAEPAEPAVAETKQKEKATTQTVEVKVSTTAQADAQLDKKPVESDKDRSAHRHDGFYLRMSLGGGSLRARGERVDAQGNSADYDFAGNALTGDLMIGGTPARGLVIGGAYIFSHAARERDYSTSNADAGMSFGIVGPFVDFYPDPKGGFHVGAMIGAAGTATYDEDQEERVSAFGGGGSAWVGYDFWIGNQWSLGAVLRASGARVETPEQRDDPAVPDRDRLGVGSIGLLASLTYH